MKTLISDWLFGVMTRFIRWVARAGLPMLALAIAGPNLKALEPVPDKLVVLTFDDSVASHYSVVRPLLKQLGFGATFFITEGFSFRTNKADYMTWEQIAELHRDGFEIGNHTRDHMGVSADTIGRLREQMEHINRRCEEHGIPRPTSFAYPGNALHLPVLGILKEAGIRFARRGGQPEHPYEWGRGSAYEPGVDDPLLIPSAGDARPDWTLDDFKRAVSQAQGGRIAVMQFHGVPDRDHPWVHTDPARFREYMQYLKANGFTVIALRDLARHVDPSVHPAAPFEVVERRRRLQTDVVVEGVVLDETTGRGMECTVSLRSEDGRSAFRPKSASLTGFARGVDGGDGSWIRVSAHPFRVELPPGRYRLLVRGGPGHAEESRTLVVERGVPRQVIRLRRTDGPASGQ